jgi:hypothetical protein
MSRALLGNHRPHAIGATIGFNPRSALFAQNEQGLWIDPTLNDAVRTWRRNLLTWTEDFSSSAWFKNGLTATANKLIENSATSSHLIGLGGGIPTLTQNTTVTFSVELKAAERSWAIVGITSTGTAAAYVDLSTGVFGSNFSSAPEDKTITDAGDGWWRVSITRVLPATATVDTRIYISTGNGVSSYLGDGASGILARKPQLEVGSTPTAHQPITDFATELKATFPTFGIFTDAYGETPAVSPGDSVGLILDQRQGALSNLGPNLIEANLTGWNNTDPTNITFSGNTVTFNVASGSQLIEKGYLTLGKHYLIQFAVVRTSGSVNCRFGTTTYKNISASGTYSFIVSNNNFTDVDFQTSGGFVGSISNITVREVPGNHAYQLTSGARPTLARVPFGGRRNLLTRTEEFDLTSAWTNAGTSSWVTANTTANPLDGQTTADTFNITDVSDSRIQQTSVSVQPSTTYTLSCYLKNNTMTTGQTFDLMVSNFLSAPNDVTARVRVNLFDGSVSNQSTGSGISGTPTVGIIPFPNGWYRVWITFTTGAIAGTANGGVQFIRTANAASFFGFGSQFEIGALSNYQRVGVTQDVTESGQPDCWALWFDGSDDHLIVNAIDFTGTTQESRRNIVSASESFGSPWTQWISSATYNEPGPEGRNNAATFVNVVGSGGANLAQVVPYIPNQQYVLTFWAKAGTSPNGNIGMFSTASGTFISTTATILSGPGSLFGTALIQINGLTSSWTKIQMVFTAPANNNLNLFYYVETSGARTGRSNTLAQFQIEPGSNPTAYQPTGTDEMTVIAGIRKLNDSAAGCLIETSSSFTGNPGALLLRAPSNAGDYYWGNSGSIAAQSVGTTFNAPTTNVVTGQSDISSDITQIRVDGVVRQLTTSDLGFGGFGNHIAYIGRRAGTSNPFNGLLHQLIMRGRATSGFKLNGSEKFTARKSGRTL